jgi:hypothetical protein
MFVQDPLNAQPTSSEPEVDHKALLITSINMYTAISYFVDKAKPRGKEERAIKDECQKFIAVMINQLNNEAK